MRAVTGHRADCVNHVHMRIAQFVILLHDDLKAVSPQQPADQRQLVGAIVYLHHDLPDFRPVLCADPLERIQFAFFDIDFQQIDPVYPMFRDDIRQCVQLAVEVLGRERIFHDVVQQRIGPPVRHAGRFPLPQQEAPDDIAVFAGVRIAPRHDRVSRVIGKPRRPGFARQAIGSGVECETVPAAPSTACSNQSSFTFALSTTFPQLRNS
jgi:hypothetical protein